MDKNLDELWSLEESLREFTSTPDLGLLLKKAKESEIPYSLEAFHRLMAGNRYRGSYIYPDFIVQFIVQCLKSIKPDRVLDPVVGMGEFLFTVAKEVGTKEAVGFVKNHSSYEFLHEFAGSANIDLRCADPMLSLSEVDGAFDAIVAPLPMGLKVDKLVVDNIEVRDEVSRLILLKSALLLKPNGIGFYVVSPGFNLAKQKSVYNQLGKFGLCVDALINVPSGSLPFTSIPASLAIVRRCDSSELFVGELRKNPDDNNILLENYLVKKNGRLPQMGAVVDRREYVSFSNYIIQEELKRLVKKSNLAEVPITNIAKEFNLEKKSIAGGFLEKSNSVYLPSIGNSEAVTSLEEATVKPQNLIQIVIDQEKYDAEYVAKFFNTPIGYKVRESVCSGTFIPKIAKYSIQTAMVYLPESEVQAQIIKADSFIRDLVTELNSLRHDLWDKPYNVRSVLKRLDKVNKEDTFESWVDTLPFPLAAVLWSYHAEVNTKEKISYLFSFFEALAEFIVVLLLSGFAKDERFYKQSRSGFLEDSQMEMGWIERSDFGSWINFGGRLSKTLRRILSANKSQEDKASYDVCINSFGRPSREFLGVLSNKTIFSILRDANELRNLWKAHAGYIDNEYAITLLTKLELLLSKTRENLADNFTTVQVLSADSMTYSDGVFVCNTYMLKGARSPFKQAEVETTEPLDKGRLYVLHEGQVTPVKLLPFIRLGASPGTAKNACYFYNRMQKDGARFVTYQFADQPEDIVPRADLDEAINLFMPSE